MDGHNQCWLWDEVSHGHREHFNSVPEVIFFSLCKLFLFLLKNMDCFSCVCTDTQP